MTHLSRSRFMQSAYLASSSKPVETEFDRMLREAHISPADAADYAMVRSWVHKNHRSKFCPVPILEACGIRPEDCV